MKTPKEVTVKLTDFQITGKATLNLWGGGRGDIVMDSKRINVTKEPSKKEIAPFINDGQFGCESIERARVELYAMYGFQWPVFVKTFRFKKNEIPMNCKRGA